jgi:cytochrome c biogenesis protein
MSLQRSFIGKVWPLLCSLKLAIYLASTATLLTMAGSLVMYYNPRVFSNMDQAPLAEWLSFAWRVSPKISWWVPLVGVLVVLFALNTVCCFVDWLGKIRQRWRKAGEYLIHLGFVLVVIAYIWGSVGGYRSRTNQLLIGETLPLDAALPGYSLRLDAFEPIFRNGRPMDMNSTVTLLRGAEEIKQVLVRTNEPLLYRGLAVLPGSFGQKLEGFNFFQPGQGVIQLAAGSRLALAGEVQLEVLTFHPHAIRLPDGRVLPKGEQLGDPALEVALTWGGAENWRGWYFLREGLPAPLVQQGVNFWPTEPIYRFYSELTINRDPGASLALAGSMLMLLGVLLATFSYYYKRNRGDRPEIT